MREIELKFEVAPRDHDAIRRAPLLRGSRARRQKLHAIYFDTRDLLLARHGLALRVRREGRKWIQCLKAGHSGDAGLHARDEWEVARRGPDVDPALFGNTPLAALLPTAAARKRLRPLFTVEMERAAWTLDVGRGARVELALDRGEVRHGRRRAPISEVEIESVEGSPDAVFGVADELMECVPLRPSAVSKAERGYALARGTKPRPVKSAVLVLDPADRVDRTAKRIVAAALAQIEANALAFLASDDDECLHQLRVGLRRLRSALRVFRGCFDAAAAREMRDDCRWLSKVTGEARDWDVFVASVLPELRLGRSSAARRLARVARERRSAAREEARAAIGSPRYGRFLLRFARWLASPMPRAGGRIRPFAQAALERQHRKALRGLRALEDMSPPQRHRVRIRLKRLRYACEALASLFGRKRAMRYVAALSKLQRDLGDAADALASLALLPRLEPPADMEHVARTRLQARLDESLAPAMRHVRALHAAPPFWR